MVPVLLVQMLCRQIFLVGASQDSRSRSTQGDEDEFENRRIHCWVLVRKGSREAGSVNGRKGPVWYAPCRLLKTCTSSQPPAASTQSDDVHTSRLT